MLLIFDAFLLAFSLASCSKCLIHLDTQKVTQLDLRDIIGNVLLQICQLVGSSPGKGNKRCTADSCLCSL